MVLFNFVQHFEISQYLILKKSSNVESYNLKYKTQLKTTSVVSPPKIIPSSLLIRVFIIEPKIGNRLTNIFISICGIYLLCSFVSQKYFACLLLLYFLISTFSIYFTISHKNISGHLCALISFAFIIICQALTTDVDFTSFRGFLMIALMKQVSLSFDITENSFDFIEILAYVFNPSTMLFGPFTTFEEFKQMKGFSRNFKGIVYETLTFCKYILYSTAFLSYSCVKDTLPLGPGLSEDYINAQSFRFDHFFICYFSLTTAILGGFSSELKTTDWSKVEWPRSMSTIVVVWNFPMHRFLHKYIYAKTKQFGYLVAMMLTFGTSSLLHGFNFQLTAVLLSLGFYAYAESIFRQKVSIYLNACVKSRDCQKDCLHQRKRFHPMTIAINLMFTLLNIWHLIYLGMPFDGSGQDHGYSYQHTLGVWKRWSFSSHIVAIIQLITSKLL